jgi:AcrR family transcriptional regulator
MRHADLRQRLLRAAEQEIALNGLGKASLRAIARRVGVTHQATAHHFEDRAGLFTALAVEGFDLLVDRTRAAVEGVEPAGGRQVIAASVAYIEFAGRHPTVFDVMFRPELLHVEDERLRVAQAAHRELLVDLIAAAQDEGWAVSVPVEELATLAWAAVHGLAVLQRDAQLAGPDADVPDLTALLTRVGQALEALG